MRHRPKALKKDYIQQQIVFKVAPKVRLWMLPPPHYNFLFFRAAHRHK